MKCPLIFQFHKGAIETRQGSVLGVFDPCFNPRAHVERDVSLIFVIFSILSFQSTRPRGARRRCLRILLVTVSFNPRAHVERDTNGAPNVINNMSFNPRAHVERDLNLAQ